MLQTGTVIYSDPENVIVQVVRQSSCGDKCSSCSGTCKSGFSITTNNIIKAKQGDVVNLETDTKSILGIAFLMYIVPLIVVIIGLVIGKKIFPNNYVGAVSDMIALIIGTVLYFLSMYIIHLYSKTKTIQYNLSHRYKKFN